MVECVVFRASEILLTHPRQCFEQLFLTIVHQSILKVIIGGSNGSKADISSYPAVTSFTLSSLLRSM